MDDHHKIIRNIYRRTQPLNSRVVEANFVYHPNYRKIHCHFSLAISPWPLSPGHFFLASLSWPLSPGLSLLATEGRRVSEQLEARMDHRVPDKGGDPFS